MLFTSFVKEKRKLVLRPQSDEKLVPIQTQSFKSRSSAQSTKKSKLEHDQSTGKAPLHKLIRYSSFANNQSVSSSQKKIIRKQSDIEEKANQQQCCQYLKNLLEFQRQQNIDRINIKQQFMRTLLQSDLFDESLSKFILCTKKILQKSKENLQNQQKQRQRQYNKPDKENYNLKIQSVLNLYSQPQNAKLAIANQKIQELLYIIAKKQQELKQIQTNIIENNRKLQKTQIQIQQTEKKLAKIKEEEDKHDKIVEERVLFVQSKSDMEFKKVKQNFTTHYQKLLQLTAKKAVFNDINSEVSMILSLNKELTQNVESLRNAILQEKSKQANNLIYTLQNFIPKYLKSVGQLINSFNMSMTEKQSHSKKFQEELTCFFKIKHDKAKLIQKIKNEYVGVLQKYEKANQSKTQNHPQLGMKMKPQNSSEEYIIVVTSPKKQQKTTSNVLEVESKQSNSKSKEFRHQQIERDFKYLSQSFNSLDRIFLLLLSMA